jgi:predicted acylesterase/phospholipase RssA
MGENNEGRRELRFALSMNGGVSLAVWIGGAVAEIDTVRRGDDFWGGLLVACGYERRALVDVMSGASAGGLNAVMMAEAIRRNVEFTKFLELWEESADISRLIKPPNKARKFDRRAVLDGQYFEDELFDALSESGTPSDELDQDLAVFASATLVRADNVEFTDVPGQPIRESRSDAYFHVARRGVSTRGLDGFQTSPLVMENCAALAKIGRATSSLPGLFEPVRFDNGPLDDPPDSSIPFGSRLVDAFRGDTTTVEIMDGGVTDNVPIARAIRAIANSNAEGRVRRVLLYLHPDPGGFGPAEPPANMVEVVRSFFGKRKETIREDIDVLRLHNEGVQRRSAAAAAILAKLRDGNVIANDRSTALQQLEVARGTLLRAAIDPAGELLWHAPNVARIGPLLDYEGAPQKDAIENGIQNALSANADVLFALPRRQTLLVLERLVGQLDSSAPRDDLGDAYTKLYDALVMCDLVHSYQLARFLGHGAPGNPSTRLLASVSELAKVVVDTPIPSAAVYSALASWDLASVSATTNVDNIAPYLDGMVNAVVENLPALDATASDAAAILADLQAGRLSLTDLQRAFLSLALEPTVSDQYIDFVRIAGDERSPAADRFNTLANRRGPKIAGRQLGHLGAFFAREWRTNDWWWGRLDSVDALLEAILDDTAMNHLYASGFLDTIGLPPEQRTTSDVRAHLVKMRQTQLIDQRLGTTSTDFAAAVAGPAFEKWARSDRRLSSLIGSRRLTSTAIRGVMTASKLLAVGKGKLARAGLLAIRPVLLAITGIVLAGRGAASAAVWTICVLMAPRMATEQQSWIVYGVGIALAGGIVGLVESRIRPTGFWTLWPYPLVVLGAGAGAGAIVAGDWIREHELLWLVAAVAAAVASLPLFFWAAGLTCVIGTGIVFALYGWVGRLKQAEEHTSWFDIWPVRSLWTAWLVSIMVFPIVLGMLPEWWLKPQSKSTTATSE